LEFIKKKHLKYGFRGTKKNLLLFAKTNQYQYQEGKIWELSET